LKIKTKWKQKNSVFSWCQTLAPVNVWLYYGAYVVLIGLAFAMLSVALNTLFSSILGPGQQGIEQSLLQVIGSVARLLGPVLMRFCFVVI
jgi:hypothetical protein